MRIIRFRPLPFRFVLTTMAILGVACGDSAATDGGTTPIDGTAPRIDGSLGMDAAGPVGDAGVPPTVGPDLPIPEATVTFFVSSSMGNDSWSGSLPEPNGAGTDGPRASLSAVAELLDGAAPGTHVLMRRGDEWIATSTLEIGAATGTVDDPILLSAYGEGAQPSIVSQVTQTIVVRGNAGGASEYFRVDDLRLTSASPVEGQLAIYTGESFHPEVPHHLTFSKLTIENNGAGMTMYGDSHLVHGSRIANNRLGMGIFVSGNDVSFQFNEFENNGLPPPDVFVHSLYISSCNGVRFENNIVHSATDGVKVRRSSNGVFSHNTFHGIEAIGIHLGGDSEGGASNNRIEANLFYGNSSDIVIKSESGTEIVPVDGLVIANNIHRDGTSGFVDYGSHITLTDVPARAVSIVNNLVYDAGDDTGIAIDNAGTDILCANNIVGQLGGAPPYRVGASVTQSNNLDYASPSSFGALELTDPAGGDFTPTAGSDLLIDRGRDVSSVLEVDYAGVTRPQRAAFDIGPYELPP